ncbi:MAG: serine/threonine-protein kinase [Gemmataceae bacterium]|nr:serine/threonine-protein kinase [Gemmataceae bacterium]
MKFPITTEPLPPIPPSPADRAYREFVLRRAMGEDLDAEEYCRQAPPGIRSSLERMMEAENLLVEHTHCLGGTRSTEPLEGWPEVGTCWQGFEVLEELGRGHFGRVYLARELELGRRLVAIKCAQASHGEAATLGRLEHPNVVPIHSIRKLAKPTWSVVCMPYLGRTTLQDVMVELRGEGRGAPSTEKLLAACRDPLLPTSAAGAIRPGMRYLDAVRRIAVQIASALAYLHQRQIKHRDLKPSNILLQPNGEPLLLDFNLCDDPDTTATAVGGTPIYAAPEQLSIFVTGASVELTPQVDVFALGVILFEWLVGRHPFGPLPETTDPERLCQHLLHQHAGGAPSLRSFQGLDRSLAQLIQRCMQFRPEDRPTAAEVEAELSRQLGWTRRLGRWLAANRRRVLAAAAVVVLGLEVGTYQVTIQPPHHQVVLEEGWQAFRAKDYRRAWEQFNQALLEGGDPEQCLFARARALQRLGEENPQFYTLAIADYRALYEKRPAPEYSAGLGYCGQCTAELEYAKHYYEIALALGFKGAALHYNLAHLYLDKANFVEATKHAKLALELNDHLTPAHYLAARLHFQAALEAHGGVASRRAMPAALNLAIQHLEKATAIRPPQAAAQAIVAAHVYAAAAGYDRSYLASALRHVEHAVELGWNPRLLENDPLLASLKSDPAFIALSQRNPNVKMAVAKLRPLDVFDD